MDNPATLADIHGLLGEGVVGKETCARIDTVLSLRYRYGVFSTQKCAFFCVFDTATGIFTQDKGVHYLFRVNLPIVGIPSRVLLG